MVERVKCLLWRNVLELSDEWRTDEPLAYLVKCYDTSEYEYKVFGSFKEADSFRAAQFEDADNHGAGQSWDVFPLYAGEPVEDDEDFD